MRKLFKAIAVSLAVIAALSVVGCKNDAPYAELELDKPSIQVKSFPGYNYVAWEPVDGAGALYVYRNDGTRIDNNNLAGANTNGANKGGWYIDTKIQNEQEYIYTVYAVVNDDSLADNVMTPGSTTSETLYNQILVAKGSKASAKTEAIVPPAGTRALDLIDYDSGDKKQYKLDADKIKVELINQRLWVSFPTKGYLAYEVVVMKGNEIELFQKLNQYNTIFGEVDNDENAVDSIVNGLSYDINNPNPSPMYDYKNFYSVDGKYANSIAVSGPGKYTVQVLAYCNLPQDYDNYPESDIITASNVIEIQGLDIATATANFKAQYTDEKTIRLLWTPAYNHNKEVYAPECYKVFFQNTFSNEWTDISGKTIQVAVLDEEGNPKTDKKGNPITEDSWESYVKKQANEKESDVTGALYYYIDYDISEAKISNEVKNYFRVMLSKDGLYEAYKSANVAAYVTTAPAAVIKITDTTNNNVGLFDLDGDGLTNDAIFQVSAPTSGTGSSKKITAELASVAYTLLPSSTYTAFDSEYTNSLTIINKRGENTFVVKDIPEDKYLSILATTTPLDATSTKIGVGYAKATFTSSPSVAFIGNAPTTGTGALTPSVTFADVDADKDLTSKDVYFKVSGLGEGQTVVNAKYATGKTAAIAQSMLFAELPETNKLTFTQLEDLAYAYTTDIEKGLYVALYAEVAEAGQLNKRIVTTSSYAVTTAAASLPASCDNTNLQPTVSVQYVDYDNDGIKNDVVIYVKSSDVEAKITKVMYAVSEDDAVADLLLTTDKATALTVAEGQYAYTWVLKDIAKDNYIEVYAKEEKDVNYGFDKAYALDSNNIKTKAGAAASGYNTGILVDANSTVTPAVEDALKITFVALGEDGLSNDALIELTLPDPESATTAPTPDEAKDTVLAQFGYAISPINDANVIYSSEYKEITIPVSKVTEPKQIFYYYVIEDVPADMYAIAYAKATRKNEFDVHTAITGSASADISQLNPPIVTLTRTSNIGITDPTEEDNIENDLQIDVAFAPGDDKSELDTIYYVIVEKDSTQESITSPSDLLRSSEVKTVTLAANTYTNYLTNIPAGATVYVMAKASAKGFYYNISGVESETFVSYNLLDPLAFMLYNQDQTIARISGAEKDSVSAFKLYVNKGQTLKSVEYFTDKTANGAMQKAVRGKGGAKVAETMPSPTVNAKLVQHYTIDNYSDDDVEPKDWIYSELSTDPDHPYEAYELYLKADKSEFYALYPIYNPANPIYTDPTDPNYTTDPVPTPAMSDFGVEAVLDVSIYDFTIASTINSIEGITKNSNVVIKVVISEEGKDDFTYFIEVQ